MDVSVPGIMLQQNYFQIYMQQNFRSFSKIVLSTLHILYVILKDFGWDSADSAFLDTNHAMRDDNPWLRSADSTVVIDINVFF